MNNITLSLKGHGEIELIDLFKDIIGEWKCSNCNAKIKRNVTQCPECKSYLFGER